MVDGILTVVFLTYFLLASGSMFRRKIAYLFPSGEQRIHIKRALFEIEQQMSRYLLIRRDHRRPADGYDSSDVLT